MLEASRRMVARWAAQNEPAILRPSRLKKPAVATAAVCDPRPTATLASTAVLQGEPGAVGPAGGVSAPGARRTPGAVARSETFTAEAAISGGDSGDSRSSAATTTATASVDVGGAGGGENVARCCARR